MASSTGLSIQHSPDSALSTTLSSLGNEPAVADLLCGLEEVDPSLGNSLSGQDSLTDGLDAQVEAQRVFQRIKEV